MNETFKEVKQEQKGQRNNKTIENPALYFELNGTHAQCRGGF